MSLFSGKTSISFIDVPFNEKDQWKKYVLWDSENKSWETRRFSAFGISWDYQNKKWYDEDNETRMMNIVNKYKRIYLIVPFADKDFVKSNGGRWDPIKKQWHTIASNETLQIYMPEDYLYEAVKCDLNLDNVDIEKWNESKDEKPLDTKEAAVEEIFKIPSKKKSKTSLQL